MADAAPAARFALYGRLLSRDGGATLNDLHAELGVSRKTVRRDLTEMEKAGLPVRSEAGYRGEKAWRLTSPDGLPPLAFAWDEAAALNLARPLLSSLRGTFIWEALDRALAKVRAHLGGKALAYLEGLGGGFLVAAPGTPDLSGRGPALDAVMLGREERRVTEVLYRSGSTGEADRFAVEPLGLVWHRGRLYLHAHSRKHGEQRTFRADRIEEATATDARFDPPADFDLAAAHAGSFGVWQSDGPARTVRVRFAPDAAGYVAAGRWHAGQTVEAHADGSLTLTLELTAFEEVAAWVLSFGPKAEVLGPPELRDQIAADLRAAAERYRPNPLPEGPA